MIDSYRCFSDYHVMFADSLPYRQLVMYIQRYSWWKEENFEKIISLKMFSAMIVAKKFSVKNDLIYLVVNFESHWWVFLGITLPLK